MRILVNATPMKGLLTGIGRYMRCLYTAMEKVEDLDLEYFDGSTVTKTMPPLPTLKESSQWMNLVGNLWKLPAPVVYAIRAAHTLKSEYALLKHAEKKDYDIFHDNGFIAAPLQSIPSSFTIHDLSLLVHPEFHPKERVWFFNHFFKSRLKHAQSIITVSNFVKNELIEKLGIGPKSIHVTHEAPAEHFGKRTTREKEETRKKFNLPERYVLFVGSQEPRKNLGMLIQALAQTQSGIHLVLAGWKGWGNKQWAHDIEKMGLSKRIHMTGYVDDETIVHLLGSAKAMVYPSIYEGFGLPVLEAMKCECPVICSNTASIPEVAGDACIYASPYAPQEWTNALDRIADDENLREDLIEKGINQSGLFSWDRTAQQTIHTLQKTSRMN